jgi:hypothetical protein
MVCGVGWGETHHVILYICVGLLLGFHLIGQLCGFAPRTMTPISLAAAEVWLLGMLFKDALRSYVPAKVCSVAP